LLDSVVRLEPPLGAALFFGFKIRALAADFHLGGFSGKIYLASGIIYRLMAFWVRGFRAKACLTPGGVQVGLTSLLSN